MHNCWSPLPLDHVRVFDRVRQARLIGEIAPDRVRPTCASLAAELSERAKTEIYLRRQRGSL